MEDTIQKIAIWAIPVLIAVVFHEVAHGWVANRLGDPTAKNLGRLTLNPIAHIDLFGTILVPVMLIVANSPFVFGYAKPVPVNFFNLRNPKRDMMWVAAAGPVMNLLLALGFVVVWRLFLPQSRADLASSAFLTPLVLMAQGGLLINISLAVFNLFPLPPLDGGRVLVGLLPEPWSVQSRRYRALRHVGAHRSLVYWGDRSDHRSADGILVETLFGYFLSRGEMDTIVSGMRPTGRLHLGHFHGALTNWLKLQEQYHCYFFVADWHALTTDYATPQGINQNTIEMVMDWLSVGLDPAKAVVFRQSRIKEHAELHLLYSMIMPVPWLERNPTYKDQIKELVGKDLSTYGFLGYPVLQAADITIYKANKVPVGVDQAPHVELTREIVRRFNQVYAADFSRARGAADRNAKASRARRPQDEQELRQRGAALRYAQGDRSES